MKQLILYAVLAGSIACVASLIMNHTVPAPNDAGVNKLQKQPHSANHVALHAAGHQEQTPIVAGDPASPSTLGPLEIVATAEQLVSFTTPARQDGAQGSVQRPLTCDEMEQRARQVEYEADRQVVRLDNWVGLTADQSTRAFMIYARASSSYDPSIPIDGQVASASTPATSESRSAATANAANQSASTASSANQSVIAAESASKSTEAQVYETLDDDQQAAFGQEWLNRDLWWTEIVSQLAADFPEPRATAAEAVVEPSAHQSDNIFDILNSVP